MVAADLIDGLAETRAVARALDDLLCRKPEEAAGRLAALEPRIEAAGRALGCRGSWLELARLKLKTSLVLLAVGRLEQAFAAAHEAWILVGGRAAGWVQALVLTQLAACYEGRKDQRAALRAIRRAEALIVAECGEGWPQVLAIRSQLIRLLEASGRDAGTARLRRERTLAALAERAGSDDHRARLARMDAVFHGPGAPPSWALTHERRWRNVFDG